MKLIIPQALAPEIEPCLTAIAPDFMVVHTEEHGALDGDACDTKAMIRWWTPRDVLYRILDAAPRLRWMHTPSAGVDGFLSPELKQRNILLTNSAGVHSIPIAEFVLMSMLTHVKRVQTLMTFTSENTWERGDDLQLAELYEQTVLIIGMGHIGEEIARRAAAFGMQVLGSRRHPRPTDGVAQVVGENGWRDLLPEVDYLVVAAPLTDATRGMIDAQAFERMKPEAYLINIALGQIVDTDALIEALRAGQIAGATLDALPEEPLPADHPLWHAPNVWITPHISWSTPRMRERSVAVFLENLRRFRASEPLLNLVDMEAGY